MVYQNIASDAHNASKFFLNFTMSTGTTELFVEVEG